MFNKKVYDMVDNASKQKLVNILKNYKYELVGNINDEHYSKTDIITYNRLNNKTLLWEIEVKNTKDFNNVLNGTYKTIYINYRKRNNESNFYCIFNQEYTQCAFGKMQQIKQSPVKDIITTYGNEKVFNVQSSLFTFYNIVNDKLIKI